jgi:hypothetical protein
MLIRKKLSNLLPFLPDVFVPNEITQISGYS